MKGCCVIIYLNEETDLIVNEINQCLKYAHFSTKQIENNARGELKLIDVFNNLARDETVGFLAYVIWRNRSKLLSGLRNAPRFRYDALTGARHIRA